MILDKLEKLEKIRLKESFHSVQKRKSKQQLSIIKMIKSILEFILKEHQIF